MKIKAKFLTALVVMGFMYAASAATFPQMSDTKAKNATLMVIVAKVSKDSGTAKADNTKVVLKAFEMKASESPKELASYSAVTDEKGEAFFKKLPFKKDRFYVASVKENGMEFKSEPLLLSEPEPLTQITIFDVSNSSEAINVLKKHIIIDSYAGDYEKQMLNFSEVLIIQNESNLVFKPDKKNKIQIGLPANTGDLRFEFGVRAEDVIYREGDGFFSISTAVYPGHSNMLNLGVNYSAELKNGTFNYRQELKLPIYSTVILLGTDKLDISGSKVIFSGEKSFGNKIYRQFQADNLKRGEIFEFDIALKSTKIDFGKVLVIILLVLVAAFAISSLFIWRKDASSKS